MASDHPTGGPFSESLFSDEFERALTARFGDDELSKAAIRADLSAVYAHDHTPAIEAHSVIAHRVWGALRALGVDGGSMLLTGQDPEIMAGLPPEACRLAPGDPARSMRALIPSAVDLVPGRWPHARVRPHRDEKTPREHLEPDNLSAVVLAVPPRVDVTYRVKAAEGERRHDCANVASVGLALTEPGGYTIVLAHHSLLDHPFAGYRHRIAEDGELVGAVRLPGGALRPGPGTDDPVDVLIWRRHHGKPLQPHTFLASHRRDLDGHVVHLNEYYLAHPANVLGQLTTRPNPWGPADLTVQAAPDGYMTQLGRALERIVGYAQAAGLTAATRHALARKATPTHPDRAPLLRRAHRPGPSDGSAAGGQQRDDGLPPGGREAGPRPSAGEDPAPGLS